MAPAVMPFWDARRNYGCPQDTQNRRDYGVSLDQVKGLVQSRWFILIALERSAKQPGNSERTASDYSEHNLKTQGFLRPRTTWLAVVSCVISE
jgi:hypothetical protein